MFYNSSKIRGRSTELVGVLFKGPRLKLAIGGTILLVAVIMAALAGVLTGVSEAQATDLIGFEQTVYRVKEGETLNLTVKTSMGGTPLSAAGNALFIETTFEEGTAKARTHFPDSISDNLQLLFSGTNATATDSVQILDDDVLDGPRFKNFFIEIRTSGAVGFVAPGAGFGFDMDRIRAEIIIEDDDPPNLIGFEQTEYTVTEGTDFRVYPVIQASRGALHTTATSVVLINTMDGTAISGADFDGISNQQIRFNNRKGIEETNIAILNDNVVEESREMFTIVLTSDDLPDGVELDPARSVATVTVVDDDRGELRFSAPEYEVTVDEGTENATATVEVGLYGVFDTTYDAFTLVVNTADGSGDNGAVAGTDYTAITNMEIPWVPKLGRGTPLEVPITILPTDNDLVFVEDKTFDVILTVKDGDTLPTDLLVPFPAEGLRAQVVIKDNEILIGFIERSFTKYSVREGEDFFGAYISASRALPGGGTVDVAVTSVDGTAVKGTHYNQNTSTNSRLEVDHFANQTTVSHIDNNDLDGPRVKNFFLELSFTDPSAVPAGVFLDPETRRVELTIIDDDNPATIGFESTRYSVLENPGNVTLEIGKFGGEFPPGAVATVVVSTIDDTAEGSTDFGSRTAVEFELDDQDETVEVTIPIFDDNLFEADETFNVVLSVDPLPFAVGLAANRTEAVVTIINDEEPVRIGFDSDAYFVREDQDRLTIPVTNLGADLAPGTMVDLRVRTIDGTAVALVDITSLDKQIELSHQAETVMVPIEIVDDSTIDGNKTFEVELSAVGSLPSGVILDSERARVTVTIVDGEGPAASIGFESTSYSLVEDQENVTLAVRNFGGDLADGATATLLVSTLDGTAESGTGYTGFSSQEIKFNDQLGTVPVTIPILDDDTAVEDTSFDVVLSGTGLDPNRMTATVTILDKIVTIGLKATEYSLLENAGQQVVDVEVKSGELTKAVAVNLTTEPGLAKSPDDYIHQEDYVVLTPADPEGSFVVPINLDRFAEGSESFEAVLSEAPGTRLPDGVRLDPSFSRASVKIKDEIILTVGFLNAPYTVAEGATNAVVTIAILSEGVAIADDKTVEVDYSTSDLTAQAGEDYQHVAGTVVFTSETKSVSIELPMLVPDDNLFEGDESFNFSLSNPRTIADGARQSDDDGIAVQLNPGTAKVTITDNEPRPEVGFLSTEYEVGEASGTVAITFGITNTDEVRLGEGVTLGVRFATADDQATLADGDYEAVDQIVVLSADKTQETVRITINDDSIVEVDESFLVTLLKAEGEYDISVPQGTVDILNDDKLTVGFGSPRYGVFESDGRVVFEIRIIDGELPAGADITVNYRIEPGSATAGDDYGSSGPGVILTAADPSGLGQIMIVDDNVPEAHESFRLVLTGDSTVFEFAPGEALVEILNDDIATIGFEMAEYEVDENIGGGSVNIKIVSDVALPTDVTLTVSTVAGTATAGSDYTAVDNMNVVLSTGDTNTIVNVSITNDGLIEPDETFEVVLSVPDGGLPPGVELDPLQSRVPVEILSEDTASAFFIIPSQQVNEGATHASTIQLLNGDQLAPGYEVTVYYGISRDLSSATAGEDYTLEGVQSVTFSSSSRFGVVNIPTIDDDLVESDEIFVIELLSSSDPDIQLGGQKRVTIVDNDSVTVDFIGPDSYTVNEGDGPVAVTFGITGGTLAANATVAVSYTIPFSGNTADVDDYTASGDIVILSADMPEVTIEIPIIDDSKPEGDEQFVIIGNFGGASGPSVRTITIKDDDPGIIGLSYSNNNPTGEVDENDGTIRFDFGAEPALVGSSVNLNYIIEPGSATAGTDYRDVSGTLDLTDFFLDISIMDDSTPESVERFVVRLSLPEGSELPPGYSLGPDLEVTIIDDDATTIGFTQTAYEVEETLDASVGFEVAAIGAPLATTVTLEYKIEDGTAEAGRDISIASRTGTITLSSSDSSESIFAFIQQDILAEYDETFVISLSLPDGTSLPDNTELYRDTTEVTIVSEDAATIGFVETTVRQNEGADAMVSIAVLTGSLGDNTEVTVGYSITDDTTVSGQDYTVTITGTRTFSGSQLVQTIVIPLTDDDLYEGSTDERLVVTLFEMSETPLVKLAVDPTEAEVLIGDNDLPEVTLLPENIRVMENAGTDMTLRATIPFPFDEDLELTLTRFHDDDDATVNEDFGTYQVPGTVTIPTGDTEVVIEATVSDDIIAEFDKVLKVGVTHLNHAGRAQPYEYPLARRPSAAVTIVVDDTLVFNLEHPDSITEGDFQVCSSFSNPFEYTAVGRPQTLMLEFRVGNPDGTSGELYYGEVMDRNNDSYTGMPVPFIPMDGDVQLCSSADFENEYYEGQRVYKINLLGHPGLHESIILGNVSSDVTVVENDLPALALNYGGNREVAEGQGIDVELELTNGAPEGLREPLTVRLALTETSTASTSDIDFPPTVTIPRGMSSATFRIEARDDMLNNEGEQFELALVSASAPSMAEDITRTVFNSGGAIAISEVRLPQTTLSPSPASVNEGEILTIELDASSSVAYQLTLAVTDESAGFDFAQDIVNIKVSQDGGAETTYTSLPATIQVAPNTTKITIKVEARADILEETDDNFTLSAIPSVGTGATTKITLNDPIVEVSLSAGMATISEGNPANIGITLSRPLTQFLKDLTADRDYVVTDPALSGSNFEDISSRDDATKWAHIDGNDHNREFFVNDLGFDFEFYGDTHRQVSISANGFLAFTSVNTGNANIQLYEDNFADQLYSGGTTNDRPIVSPFWSDHDVRTGSIHTAVLGASPDRRYIVQWTNVNHVITSPNRQMVTFQIVLFENGQIEFRYENVSNDHRGDHPVAVGITDGTGTNFVNVGINKMQVVSSNTRIVFTPSYYKANVVTKNAAGRRVASYDIRDNIAVGTDSGMFTTNYPQNDSWDGDQIYTVELDSNIPLITASGSATTYTFVDDEKPMVTLERVSGSDPIMEGEEVELRVRLNNAPPSGAPQDLVVNLMADTASTTALTTEYSFDPSVTIVAGSSSAVFKVTANTDTLVELDESLTIKVASFTYGPVTAEAPTMQSDFGIMIRSDDTVAVTGITASDTNEGDVVTVRVSLDRALPANTADGAVMLVLDGTDDRTKDVTGSSWDITSDLRSGTSAEVMITLTEDKILEGDEQVTLNLMVASALDDVLPAGDRGGGSVSFNILDDENGTVSIAAPPKNEYPENEDVELTFALPTDVLAGAPITIQYRIEFVDMDGNGNTRAEASAADITGGKVSGSAVIPANQNSVPVTIDLNDDSDPEETELFEVSLTSVVADVPVTRDETERIIAILDKGETLKYSFVETGKASEENTAYTVRLRRVGELPVGGGATVLFTTSGSGSSPASLADFDAGAFPSGNFVFTGYAAESTLVTLPTVADDNDIEGDETLRITLTGRTETHDVTLADNDVPLIDIERVSSPGPVAEGASVQFRARLVNGTMSGATEDLTVNLVMGTTSTVSMGDVSFPDNVTIPMRMSEALFNVNVTNDELAEFTEMVRVEAQSVIAGSRTSTNAGRGYDLEITSDDKITAEIEVDDTDEDEMAQITIKLSQALPENVPSGVLRLNLVNDNERQMDLDISGFPADVTDELKRSSATQAPAPVSTVVMVDLTDDDLLEGDEIVRLLLRIEPGMSPDLATLLPNLPTASFEITDNESGAIGVSRVSSATEYDEGDSVQFEFSLPTGVIATTDITINYEIIAPPGLVTVSAPGLGTGFAKGLALPVRGLAQAQQPPLSVTIPAGQNSVVLTIQLTQDATPEETEQLTVRILSVSSGPSGPPVEVDPQNRETVITVLDDEDPVLQIIGSGEINEDDGTYTVCLRRLGRVTADEEIPFTIIGPGADQGDFTSPLSGVFKFNGFDTKSEPLTLILDDDNSEEESKPFQISVENPMTKAYASVPIVDPVTGVVFTSITLIDSDVADFLGDLPPTGGPVLPVWLLLLLALTGVALLVPALRRI